MASSLPNSVIQKSKNERDALAHLPGTVYDFTNVGDRYVDVVGESIHHIDFLKVEEGVLLRGLVCHVVPIEPYYRVTLLGYAPPTGERFQFSVIFRNPPDVTDPDYYHPRSWGITYTQMRAVGDSVRQASVSKEAMPEAFQRASDEAFDAVCTDWFYKGH